MIKEQKDLGQGDGAQVLAVMPATLDSAAIENLRRMVDGDLEFLAELIDTFLSTTARLMAELHQALEQGDAASFERAAHSFKSNAATFGAMALADLCRELELQGKAGSLNGVAEKVTLVEVEYERAKPAVSALCKKDL